MHDNSFFSQIKPVFTFSLPELIVTLVLLEALIFGITIGGLDLGGLIQQSLTSLTSSSDIADQYQAVSDRINANEYVANTFVFILWSITGLILFNTFLFIRYSEKSVAELVQLFMKGGEHAHEAFQEKAVQMTIRIVAVILLFVLIFVFIGNILPLLVVLFDPSRLDVFTDYVISIGGIWLILSLVGHSVIVLLRCLALRRRLILK